MYNRSPSRNHRSRGFKVKHILQISVLVAVCFWLVYQVKHSHEKKKEFGENGGKLASETGDDREVLRLGRKDVFRVTETGKSPEKDVEENEEDEQVEDDTGKGGSDNEIDEHGKEKIDDENHEEFEDAEKEREEIDENHEDNQEVEAVLEDHEEDQEGGDESTHGAREQHYKGDDASSEVAQAAGIIVPDTDNATVNHTDENADIISDVKKNVTVPDTSNSTVKQTDENADIIRDVKKNVTVPDTDNATVKHTDENAVIVSDVKKNVTENSNEQLLKGNPEGANTPSSVNLMSSNFTKIELDHSIDMTQAQNATYGDNHDTNMSLFPKGNNTDSESGENQLDIHAVRNSTQHVNNSSEGSLGSSGEVKLPTAKNVTESEVAKTDDGDSANSGTDKIRSSNSENIVEAGGNERPESDTNVDTSVADPRDRKDDFGHSLAQKEKESRTELPDIKAEVQHDGGVEVE